MRREPPSAAAALAERDTLLDVSRLVWRSWRGGLPTGVDRVCLAYAEHFGRRSLAVVQRGGRHYVLTPHHSDELFALFAERPDRFRRRLAKLALRAMPTRRNAPPQPGMLYLNVGHTGLQEQSLAPWILRNRVRAVFLIHDLIPLVHPEFCRAGEQAKHRSRMENVLASAIGLIGNSQATIDDIRNFAAHSGLPLPSAVAALIAGPAMPSGVPARKPDRPYFVTVGTIEGRKNHVLLLHIWKRLVARHGPEAPMLFIVGQRGWEANEAFAILDRVADLREHVIELGRCADSELASLLVGARALLMPSFAEGFGLPVVEALQLRTPVIASNLPVFREFAGDIPTYLDSLDGIGWEAAISEFTGNSPERREQLRRMAGYRGPDWQSHFDVVDEWLRTLP